MQTFDQNLFLALNFNGGAALDRAMLIISGTLMWLPLYALILFLVWRKAGWRNLVLFVVLMVAALALSDIVAGIFKHAGLLKGLLPEFTPRPRPMFAPALEGLSITPDSLRTLRRAEPVYQWMVHVPREALAGLYGTVSAHAATIVTLAVLSASVIGRRWFSYLMLLCTVVICYSRIYLGKHFPMDLVWGSLLGIALGYGAVLLFRRLSRKKE